MAHRRTPERQTGSLPNSFFVEVVDIVQRKSDPDELIRMLYESADDSEAPANSRLSAIKEILDRTVGKGVMLGEEQEKAPIEIVFRVVDEAANSA